MKAHGLAEPLAALLVRLAPACGAIVAPASSSGKDVAPRVAALLDVMQVSQVTKALGPTRFERLAYAGTRCGRLLPSWIKWRRCAAASGRR